MTTQNAEAAALAQRQIQAALSNALADASALQAENAALRADARQLAERMHGQVAAATAAAAQLEAEVASRQAVAQELAAALEHASDERDTLLTEAAAAAELRRRLAQATAECDALSEQNAQLQREAQQLTAAVVEAEAVAGAALSDGRRLAGELVTLRGGQAAGDEAAAAEAADLRRQLDQTRQDLTDAQVAAAELRADDSRRSAAAADARAEAGAAAAVRQARDHDAGLQRLLGATVLAALHSQPPPRPPLQQRLPSPLPLPPPLLPIPQQPQPPAADTPAPAAAAGLTSGLQAVVPAVQSACLLAAALRLRATAAASRPPQMQAAAEQHCAMQQLSDQESEHRPPLRPASHTPAQPCLPPRCKQHSANGSGQRLPLPLGTARKRPRLDARRSSATPSVQSTRSSPASRTADASLPPAVVRRPATSVHATPAAPDAIREAGGSSGGHRKQKPGNATPNTADAAQQTPAQPPQHSPSDSGVASTSSITDDAAAAGNAALLELLQRLQLEDGRRREAAQHGSSPATNSFPDNRAAERHPHHRRAAEAPAAAAAAAAAATSSPAAAPRLRRQQWHADGRLCSTKHAATARSSGGIEQQPTLQRQPATKSAAQRLAPAQSLQLLPQPPSTKGARFAGDRPKTAASALSRKVHTSRRRAAAEESQGLPAADAVPAHAPAAARASDEAPSAPQPPAPPPLWIAARLSAEIAALDAQHGQLLREDAAARRAAEHAAGGPSDPAAETRVRSCAQLLAEVQAAMQERGAQLRSARRAERPEMETGSRVAA